MTQFQQPSRRNAPGVVDLGTGRQADMQQRNMQVGSVGSRGVIGGQSLRGTDSPIVANTVADNVDPVASLLGAVSTGIDEGLRAQQQAEARRRALKRRREEEAAAELAHLETLKTNDIADGLDDETVTRNHLDRIRKLRGSNVIGKDLDAYGRLNSELVRTDRASDTDIAKRELDRLDEKLAKVAYSPSKRLELIDGLRNQYKGTQVGSILSDNLNKKYNAALGAQAQMQFQQEVKKDTDRVLRLHTRDFPDAGSILAELNSQNIVASSDEAYDQLLAVYRDKYFGAQIQAAPPLQKEAIEDLAFRTLSPLVARDLGIADRQIQENNLYAEQIAAVGDLHDMLTGDTADFDAIEAEGGPSHQEQSAIAFSRAAGLAFDQADSALPKGEYMFQDFLLKQGVDLARNSEDPIEAMKRLRGVIPEDLQNAVDQGWIPKGTDPGDWQVKRDSWMSQLRTVQLKATTGAFAQLAENNSGSIENLLVLASSLSDMAGFQGPVGLSGDGTSIDMPTGLSMEGDAYNKIWTSIQTPMTKLLEAQAEANQPGFLDAAITSGSLDIAADITRGQDKALPDADTISRSATLRFISEAPNLEAIEQWLDSYKQSDEMGNEVLPEFFHEYDGLVKRARRSNIDPGSPQFRGMLHGLGVRAWQNGPGMTTGDESSSGLRILVPTSTQTYVTNSFYGTKKGDGPLESGPAAAGIATLWGSLGNEDARRKVFGDRYNDARLTFKSHNRDGNWNDEDLGWDGVVTNPTANRAQRAEGFSKTQDILGGEDPIEFVQAAVDLVMSPALAEGALPQAGDITGLAVYSALGGHKDDIIKSLADELGIDPEETDLWYAQALPLMQGIAADVALDIAEAVGTRPEDAGSTEGFAQIVADALDDRLSRALDGRVWVGGEIQDDPTGSFANAAKQMRERNIDNPNSSGSMFNYYTEAPFAAVSSRTGRGESEDGMAETFYAMFPALDRDAMDQDALFAKARERAGDRKELTAKDLIAAHYVLTTGDDGIFGDEGMFRDVKLNTRRVSSGGAYSMRFELPNLSGGEVYGMLEFAPPVDVRSSNPIDVPRSVHYVPPPARVISSPTGNAVTDMGSGASIGYVRDRNDPTGRAFGN